MPKQREREVSRTPGSQCQDPGADPAGLGVAEQGEPGQDAAQQVVSGGSQAGSEADHPLAGPQRGGHVIAS